MDAYTTLRSRLQSEPTTWLVTGVAGFIGSNLLEALLRLDQTVIGLDNFATGHQRNIDEVLAAVGPRAASRFRFIEGDITDLDVCRHACRDARYVLHQAALGSVPRSLTDPIGSNRANVDGFLNMLVAARDAGVSRFVYAASSSTYGDHPGLPKVENQIGRPLSPYAVTKYVNELYADVFAQAYQFTSVGLRYFNVFGRRQDPYGPYAAVIPRWVANLLRDQGCVIYGDGETSRDFCYIDNVVQANILSAAGQRDAGSHTVYNVAYGARTTLVELFEMLRDGLRGYRPEIGAARATHEDFRAGDVRHSEADISKARRELGYSPTHSVSQGIAEALAWYVDNVDTYVAR
jgi:UDP-N-acetylglucosamine 4-epimerase